MPRRKAVESEESDFSDDGGVEYTTTGRGQRKNYQEVDFDDDDFDDSEDEESEEDYVKPKKGKASKGKGSKKIAKTPKKNYTQEDQNSKDNQIFKNIYN
mmetsp:Transcript_35418/g.31895  ORF Transcript_35418/g.31895 Transcript_35418/m.31895 type:complete len:99 (-) Transcript_35418:446-742(-)